LTDWWPTEPRVNGERIAGFLTVRLIRYDERGLPIRHLVKGSTPVKSLTITLPDEVYEAAEKTAGDRGVTLSSEIATWIANFVRHPDRHINTPCLTVALLSRGPIPA
jgi:hypothetical protein